MRRLNHLHVYRPNYWFLGSRSKLFKPPAPGSETSAIRQASFARRISSALPIILKDLECVDRPVSTGKVGRVIGYIFLAGRC